MTPENEALIAECEEVRADIADQIRALKPGDRVRVTFEDTVRDNCCAVGGAVRFNSIEPLLDDATTVISIEVIERPLAVGDRFERNGEIGEVLALHGEYAWMLWGVYGHSVTKTKVVNSYRRVTP